MYALCQQDDERNGEVGKDDKSHLKLDREDQVISTQVILTHALFGPGKHRPIAQKENAHHSFYAPANKG